jgi:TetR/AcrR family transcriptional regulator, transcriptional repressor for nem operon
MLVNSKYNDRYLFYGEIEMRASQEHMQKIRSHILDAAGVGFREDGYGGLGINGLAQRAGMTSGAFYGHFTSKSEAFSEVVKNGLTDYAVAIEGFENEYGSEWSKYFLDYYLGKEHVNNLACSCAVPGLSADVMRADKDTKAIYSSFSEPIAKNIANGLHKQGLNDAWALMALLAGAVMMARCTSDPKQAKDILDAAQSWATKIVEE